jgi:BirA family biotin operon repressor/biotin-[acetyl-CoA-carboxylase] ligase
MNLIKLSAIDSTNAFLKKMSLHEFVENFTVVTAMSQTDGKGQMGAKWISEPNKNLIMSILIRDLGSDINSIFTLNVTVALSIIEVFENYKTPNLAIKWPNDILADGKKIGGILIENTIKANGTIESIIGIGLNINQTTFINLPKASSLKCLLNNDFEIDTVLNRVFTAIKNKIKTLESGNLEDLWKTYNDLIFKKGIPMPFEDKNKNRFMGIIQNVDKKGQLAILLEDETLKSFQVKEIQLLY